jgi:hypothetical protein
MLLQTLGMAVELHNSNLIATNRQLLASETNSYNINLLTDAGSSRPNL